MNFVTLLAHGTDQHTENTSSVEHFLTQPLIAVSIYIVIHIAIFYALQSKNRKRYLLHVVLGLNLIIGIGTFSLVPVVSILAITLGIVAALVVSLGAIVS